MTKRATRKPAADPAVLRIQIAAGARELARELSGMTPGAFDALVRSTARADRAAAWVRVSTSEQNTDEQLANIRSKAEVLGKTIVAVFLTEDSASAVGAMSGKGDDFKAKTDALIGCVARGDAGFVIIWALDRLTREGPEFTFRSLRLIDEAGAGIASYYDDWLNTVQNEMARDMMITMAATLAKAESLTKSRRATMGNERRRKAGLPLGMAAAKAKGEKEGNPQKYTRGPDKKPRRGHSGSGWTPERRAALAERNRQRAEEKRRAAAQDALIAGLAETIRAEKGE